LHPALAQLPDTNKGPGKSKGKKSKKTLLLQLGGALPAEVNQAKKEK
jgi:hypothetical protein